MSGACGLREQEEPRREPKKEAESKDSVKDKGKLMMATTTSTEDTGLLDYLKPLFKEDTGWDLEWNAVGTGEALKMGENGDVDVVTCPCKGQRGEFIANGYGVERFPVMYNDFVVIGPKEPIAKTEDINAVFTDHQPGTISYGATTQVRIRRRRRYGAARA